MLQGRIGTTRDIVVTPSAYGDDNRVTLDAIARLGSNARGIAVVRPTITDGELKTLDNGGIRGIRFSLVDPFETIEPLSKRVAALGWHVQINLAPNKLRRRRIYGIACRVRLYSTTWGTCRSQRA